MAVGGLAAGAFSRAERRHRLMSQPDFDHLARPANLWTPLSWLLPGAGPERQQANADLRQILRGE